MEENNLENVLPNEPKKKKKTGLIIGGCVVLVAAVVVCFCFKDKLFKGDDKKGNSTTNEVVNDVEQLEGSYRLSGNGLENFDLVFLQLEDNDENVIYSPLSIKYALAMLNEGAKGDTKTEISNLIGDYIAKKYINTKNMSFANALFIKDSFKNEVNAGYITALGDKYGAEVIYDNFATTNVLNGWLKAKTLGLIDNIFDDISEFEYILVNALGIDMEWKNVIQHYYDMNTDKDYGLYYTVVYENEKYWDYVEELNQSGFDRLEFGDNKNEVSGLKIGASLNNYDIVNELGEENIRKTVGDALDKWLEENPDWKDAYADKEGYLDEYVKTIDENYESVAYSTDFMLYNDDEVKVFVKDLKEYNGTTLEYVGIMPKEEKLNDFVKNLDATKINGYLSKLKDVSKREDFTDRKITKVTGSIPIFAFDYSIDLKRDLKALGVNKLFTKESDLSGITNQELDFKIKHKANIDFSNDGIKASAVTAGGGQGDASDGFYYNFEVPVEEIDMTFDKPYMFIIRDKSTGEVWFTGKVNTPTEYQEIWNN